MSGFLRQGFERFLFAYPRGYKSLLQDAPQEYLAKGKTLLYSVRMTPLDRAISKAGGQSALAKALNIRPQAVQQWAKVQRVPAERVLDVERITGVSRFELRPDVYGDRRQCPVRATDTAPQTEA